MSTEGGAGVGLVPAQPGSLSKIGIACLAARGRRLLQSKEEAESWLRNGLDLLDTAYLLPGRNWSIPNDQPTKTGLPILDYVRQITLRTAQDFVSHYPLNPKQTTRLFREITLGLNKSF